MSEFIAPTTIEGNRIILKAKIPEMAEDMFLVVKNNPGPWLPWMGCEETLQSTREFLEFTDNQRQNRLGYYYAILSKTELKILGAIDLIEINWGKKSVSISYWLDQTAEGKGYISEAMPLAEKLAIDLGFKILRIVCHERNIRSQKIPLKFGYKFTEIDKEGGQRYNKNQPGDLLVYTKYIF